MSQERHASKLEFSQSGGPTRNTKRSSQTPRIKSAILHGKATPLQNYRGVHLMRFEHKHGKDGPMVVIAEEWPFRTHGRLNNPKLLNVSEQAGKHFNVICSYKTSDNCIDAAPKRDKLS